MDEEMNEEKMREKPVFERVMKTRINDDVANKENTFFEQYENVKEMRCLIGEIDDEKGVAAMSMTLNGSSQDFANMIFQVFKNRPEIEAAFLAMKMAEMTGDCDCPGCRHRKEEEEMKEKIGKCRCADGGKHVH